jgi:rubrerythrin
MSTRLDLSKLSVMDALDLAKLIEMEACHRYQMFASQLGRTGGYDAGAFFTTMAENEAKHGQELEARRKALFGDTPARLTLDDLFDVEAPEMGAPHRGMSTVQAFEVALAAEKKAYDFYDMALPGVTDTSTCSRRPWPSYRRAPASRSSSTSTRLPSFRTRFEVFFRVCPSPKDSVRSNHNGSGAVKTTIFLSGGCWRGSDFKSGAIDRPIQRELPHS